MSELWQLERLTTGEQTSLKRSAGTLELNVAALRAFYKADTCREKSWEEQRYAAMCMECLWAPEDETSPLPMEECLKRMCWEDNTLNEALSHRIDAMLETPWGEDGFLLGKMLNLVRMIRGRGGMKPDFEQLAKDLRYWNGTKRLVQRRWLKTIYRNQESGQDIQLTQEQDKEGNEHDD